MVGRIIVLGFQSGLFKYQEEPENNFALVLSSWFKAYVIGCIFTIVLIVPVEFALSIYFIQDDAENQKLWRPLTILSISILFAAFGASCFTLEWSPWYLPPLIGALVSAIGVMLFLGVIYYVKIMDYQVKQRIHKTIEYSLNVRYQLQEVLFYGKILEKAFILLGVLNIATFGLFILSNVPIAHEYFDDETIQLFDCAFNLMIVLNAPCIAVGGLYYNEYVVGEVRRMFRMKLHISAEDAGQVYFNNLLKQWEEQGKGKDTEDAMKFIFIFLLLALFAVFSVQGNDEAVEEKFQSVYPNSRFWKYFSGQRYGGEPRRMRLSGTGYARMIDE